MLLHIMSDLHLEISSLALDYNYDSDIVILAGDIHSHTKGLIWARETFKNKKIIYVPGNHEFYTAHYQGLLKELRSKALELDIIFLNKNTVIIDDICFIGCILWTDFNINGVAKSHISMKKASANMYDFQEIRYGTRKNLTPTDSVRIHMEQKSWIANELDKHQNLKTVVITHHAPHINSVPDRFKNDNLTPAFTSDLSNLISTMKPNLWIHGHTHDPFDYIFDQTRIVCNPRGYPTELNCFNDNFIIEI